MVFLRMYLRCRFDKDLPKIGISLSLFTQKSVDNLLDFSKCLLVGVKVIFSKGPQMMLKLFRTSPAEYHSIKDHRIVMNKV